MDTNYYSLLQLKRHCTKEEVHKMFGKLVSKYSVTNQVNDPNLIALCEAYEVLSDSFRRALYDLYGEQGIKKGVQSDELFFDPWIYHGDVMATYSEYCALKNPISNLFIKSNSSMLMDFKQNKSHPNIIKLPLKLTLNEIFDGSTKLISFTKKSTISNFMSNKMQFMKVIVPRGFPTGGILKSEVSNSNIGFEDVKTLYEFTTENLPHKFFKRDKMNLIMVNKVSLKQSLFGVKVNIETLDHKVLRVNITQVIKPDYVKIIHNEGMPSMNDLMQRGNIIIKFDIMYPLYLPISNKNACELMNDNIINK